MSIKKKAVALLGCAALAFSLVGCQQSETKEPEPTDVQLMQDAGDTRMDQPFYVLVVGNDSRTGTVEIDKPDYADGSGRSDTTMLVRVDPTTYQVGIVTIPRDTAISLNGQTMKFNEAYHAAGIEETLHQVKLLTGVSPLYYMDMSFVQFEKFVNELGGLTANVPIDMGLQDIVSGSKISLSAGVQDLDGAESLVLARSRKVYEVDQDACRQIQDRQLVEVGIKKVAADPVGAAAHVQALMSNVDTNWPADDLAKTVADFAANADKIAFVSGTGPYSGDIDEAAGGIWLATRDEAAWKQVIQAVEAGEDPTTVVPLPQIIAKN